MELYAQVFLSLGTEQLPQQSWLQGLTQRCFGGVRQIKTHMLAVTHTPGQEQTLLKLAEPLTHRGAHPKRQQGWTNTAQPTQGGGDEEASKGSHRNPLCGTRQALAGFCVQIPLCECRAISWEVAGAQEVAAAGAAGTDTEWPRGCQGGFCVPSASDTALTWSQLLDGVFCQLSCMLSGQERPGKEIQLLKLCHFLQLYLAQTQWVCFRSPC